MGSNHCYAAKQPFAAAPIAAQRGRPSFLIVDADGTVIATSNDNVLTDFWPRIQFDVHALLAQRASTGETPLVFEVDENVIFRVTEVAAPNASLIGLFLDHGQRRRTSVDGIVSRFGISPREADVLKLLVQSHNTHAIAARLCIAESTVTGHIKSLYRKTGTRKRSELVARIFDLDVEA